MPVAFPFTASPFDVLGADERLDVERGVDLTFLRAGERVLDVGDQPSHLFVLSKGRVERYDAGALSDTLRVADVFDARGLVAGRVSSRFVAAEDTLAYLVPRATVLDLVARNATFGALLFADLSTRLAAPAEQQGRQELHALALTRVDQAVVRAPCFVEASTPVEEVVRIFHALGTKSVLVRFPDRLGMFTVTDLVRALVDGRPLGTLPVGDLAAKALVSVRPSAVVGDALAAMIQHDVHRVVVGEGGDVRGVLHALDLFSFLSNQSYLLGVEIAEAKSIEELGRLAGELERLVGLLHRGGSKTSFILSLKHVLDLKLLARVWALVAPAGLVEASCLYVMGSEGRGEQLLRTDQDNGLVVADHAFESGIVADAAVSFSGALRGFGFPDCPGGIMVENAAWRHSSSGLRAQVRRWALSSDGDALIALAAFMDAKAVLGDETLLEGARDELFAMVRGDAALLRRFAAPADRFETGRSWWGRLWSPERGERLDLKKAGLFPIVHGARALALERGIRATSTTARLSALADQGLLTGELATALTESFHHFLSFRLTTALLAEPGAHRGSDIELAVLSPIDRELLKDTLSVVRRFRELLRIHFRLEAG